VSGSIVQQNISIGGSGSSYLYGFMDSQYKDEMTEKECQNLVLNGMFDNFILFLLLFYNCMCLIKTTLLNGYKIHFIEFRLIF